MDCAKSSKLVVARNAPAANDEGVEEVQIMNTVRYVVALSCIVVGCSASQGPEGPGGTGVEGEPVAGGQSGTDSSGGYWCDLEDAVETSIPLDEVALSCSPEQSLDAIEGTRLFLCAALGTSFTVDVRRGASASLLTGKLYSDTDSTTPPTDCAVLRVAATTTIVAGDGSLSFSSSHVTVDHLCGSFSFEGKAQRRLGCEHEELTFALLDDATRLFVIALGRDGLRTDSCALVP